jgi:hypothetical protein
MCESECLVCKYVNQLKVLSDDGYIGSPIELFKYTIPKYSDRPCGELMQVEKEHMKMIWSLFKLIFWDNEHLITTKSSLYGPFSISIEEKFSWITINTKPLENRFIRSKPFSVHDEEENKFYYTDESFKNRILDNEFFKGSNISKYSTFKNIDEETADQMALQFRVGFYESLIELKDFITNNLVKIKVKKENNTYFNVYSFIDYGIPDPDYEKKISENCGTPQELLSMYRLSYTLLKHSSV